MIFPKTAKILCKEEVKLKKEIKSPKNDEYDYKKFEDSTKNEMEMAETTHKKEEIENSLAKARQTIIQASSQNKNEKKDVKKKNEKVQLIR